MPSGCLCVTIDGPFISRRARLCPRPPSRELRSAQGARGAQSGVRWGVPSSSWARAEPSDLTVPSGGLCAPTMPRTPPSVSLPTHQKLPRGFRSSPPTQNRVHGARRPQLPLAAAPHFRARTRPSSLRSSSSLQFNHGCCCSAPPQSLSSRLSRPLKNKQTQPRLRCVKSCCRPAAHCRQRRPRFSRRHACGGETGGAAAPL